MTVRMVDIAGKPNVSRTATATGRILLRPETTERMRKGDIEKGDVVSVAQIAGIQAAKKTPDIIPLCHSVALTSVKVEVEVGDGFVKSACTVRANYATGVEMEALTGVTASLLAVWDMVKYLEKDEQGQYLDTAIMDVRIETKKKG